MFLVFLFIPLKIKSTFGSPAKEFMLSLKGQVALITGAGRGIGAAAARVLAVHGANVVLVSRTLSELNQVKNSLIQLGISEEQILVIPTDLRDPSAIENAFAQAKNAFGPISILVNNAGTIVSKKLLDLTTDDWDQMMDVNLKAMFLCCQFAFRQMQSRGGGEIVNISSLGGVQNTEKFPGYSVYTASKSGVVGLTEALAVEGREFKIRVNAIAPGAVDTKMFREAATHLKTSTTPDHIAQVILSLCDRAQSEALSGVIIPIFSNE